MLSLRFWRLSEAFQRAFSLSLKIDIPSKQPSRESPPTGGGLHNLDSFAVRGYCDSGGYTARSRKGVARCKSRNANMR
jgi:hypothetical protein